MTRRKGEVIGKHASYSETPAFKFRPAKSAILTKDFRRISQYLQTDVGIVPQVKLQPLPDIFFPSLYSDHSNIRRNII
jgi:hypothetical protein